MNKVSSKFSSISIDLSKMKRGQLGKIVSNCACYDGRFVFCDLNSNVILLDDGDMWTEPAAGNANKVIILGKGDTITLEVR